MLVILKWLSRSRVQALPLELLFHGNLLLVWVQCSLLSHRKGAEQRKISLSLAAWAQYQKKSIVTWISQSCPLIKIFSASSDVEHSIDGRGSSDDFTSMPGASVAIHGQAGSTIRLGSGNNSLWWISIIIFLDRMVKHSFISQDIWRQKTNF